MSYEQFRIHLRRVDGQRRMARFYSISLEPTLWGDFSVERSWGRIGTRGRTRLDLFADRRLALAHFLEILKRKTGRGYRPDGRRRNLPRGRPECGKDLRQDGA